MKHLLFTIILRWTSSSVWIFASSAFQAFTLNRLFYLKPPISSGRDLNLFHTLQLHHILIILASFLCTSLWQPTLPHKLWDDSSSPRFSTLSTPRILFSSSPANLLPPHTTVLVYFTQRYLYFFPTNLQPSYPDFIRMSASENYTLLPPLPFSISLFLAIPELSSPYTFFFYSAVNFFFCWRRRSMYTNIYSSFTDPSWFFIFRGHPPIPFPYPALFSPIHKSTKLQW